MSEYSASAPVVDRNTVPMTARPAALWWLKRNSTPYTGFSASSTFQSELRFTKPTTARNENQIMTTVPNVRPMRSVPRDCTANRQTMITMVIISVSSLFSLMIGSSSGSVSKPSTAELIETAGVSTESARNAAPPSMAGIASHAPYLRISEYSAKMPPSPLLSMRMAMNTYLTVVISVIDQKTSDRMPSTAARSVCAKPPWPLRNVCMVYSGEVPMSPYTTPSATMAMAGVILSGPDWRRLHQRPMRPLLAASSSFAASCCCASCSLMSVWRSSLVRTLCETFGACVYVAA